MAINLEKKVEQAKLVLSKKSDNREIRCEAGVMLDCSGSLEWAYRDGIIQDVTENVLAVAMNIDNDQKIDTWVFDDEARYVGEATPTNIENYVNTKVKAKCKWRGTNYAPALIAITEKFLPVTLTTYILKPGFFNKLFRRKEAIATTTGGTDLPVIVFFFTDGDCYDETEASREIIKLKDTNIFIQFIGIGPGSFTLLKRFARENVNIGYVDLNSLSTLTDEDFMNTVISDKFVSWAK